MSNSTEHLECFGGNKLEIILTICLQYYCSCSGHRKWQKKGILFFMFFLEDHKFNLDFSLRVLNKKLLNFLLFMIFSVLK